MNKWAVLMPHPPIIIPRIGCGQERKAQLTLDGTAEIQNFLKDKKPSYIILLSPHQMYSKNELLINSSQDMKCSFAQYGYASCVIKTQTATEKLHELAIYLSNNNLSVCVTEDQNLYKDQGSTVPLYWLSQIWAPLPPLIIASPIGLSRNLAYKLGKLLSSWDEEADWGLLASGDLSHRLIPEAPAGYSPQGKVFDKAVIDALKDIDADKLLSLEPEIIEAAGECGLRSVITMIGLCNSLNKKHYSNINIFSYEGPFGVGYCNAVYPYKQENK